MKNCTTPAVRATLATGNLLARATASRKLRIAVRSGAGLLFPDLIISKWYTFSPFQSHRPRPRACGPVPPPATNATRRRAASTLVAAACRLGLSRRVRAAPHPGRCLELPRRSPPPPPSPSPVPPCLLCTPSTAALASPHHTATHPYHSPPQVCENVFSISAHRLADCACVCGGLEEIEPVCCRAEPRV